MLKEPMGPNQMVASMSNRDWPINRGMHVAESGKFYIWVNEEDHVKFVSYQQGGDISSNLSILNAGCDKLEQALENLKSG